ncbi:MAG: hypothetical protein Q4F53_00100 [Nesterenkonia sp.]|nr:hypothetical protein [Nesterenkonia sp.]
MPQDIVDDGHRDRLLIRRFPALLHGLLPADHLRRDGLEESEAAAAPISVDAEVLHALCTADGLLELLDWSRCGVGADPLACMWLGSLRWYRLVTGASPPQAPTPPPRDLDASLETGLRSGELTLRPGTGGLSRSGLATGEMAYPSAPAQADAEDPDALIRVLPLALVPYVELRMLHGWADQTVCLTQGGDRLRRRAAVLVEELHHVAGASERTERVVTALARLGEIAEDGGYALRAVLSRVVTALDRALEGEVPREVTLHPRLRGFASAWRKITDDDR